MIDELFKVRRVHPPRAGRQAEGDNLELAGLGQPDRGGLADLQLFGGFLEREEAEGGGGHRDRSGVFDNERTADSIRVMHSDAAARGVAW